MGVFFLLLFTMLRMPFGVMVSSPDQTPQVPFTYLFIIHYIERPAPSVRLVKAIHLRALLQIVSSLNRCYKLLLDQQALSCHFFWLFHSHQLDQCRCDIC